MQITFIGATQEVTGSAHLVKANNHRILLDFGLYQGQHFDLDTKNRQLPIDPKLIDAILVSHAHIDHIGRIPYLVKHGYQGPIYSTFATRDLAYAMLQDSAYIQEMDAKYINKKCPTGKDCSPLYTSKDVIETIDLFQSVNYERWIPILPGVKACFFDAGHILGSSIILLEISEKGQPKKRLLYTGDLGRRNLPILRNPQQITKADFIITESTYGNRLHEKYNNVYDYIESNIHDSIKNNGKILIPAFSLERTQELVYIFHKLIKEKRLPKIPIYVDSPLASNVTEIFRQHPECFDAETNELFLKYHENPFGFSSLKYTTDVRDSKKLQLMPGPMIIISASGMCNNGRIVHHIKNNIEDPHTTILIVGFMARGTLGRKLVDKAKTVRIFGKEYRNNAHTIVLNTFSAHADYNDLINYLSQVSGVQKIFCVHGELDAMKSLQSKLQQKVSAQTIIPSAGETFKL